MKTFDLYGELIIAQLKKKMMHIIFQFMVMVKLPRGGIKIKNFNESKLPTKVIVNGKVITDFSEKVVSVKEFPADLVITYKISERKGII